MKRFLSLVLVCAMMTTMIVPGLSFAAGAEDIAGDRVIAEMTDTAPALDQAITEEVWGAPAASINADSANTALHNYNAEVEPVSADFYFRYDSTNLYIGMVSEDSDLAGHDDAWAGDGLQLNISADNVNDDNAAVVGAYVTLKADAASFGGGGTDGVEHGIVAADGKLNAIVRIPLSTLGVEGKVGTRLTFNLLRIIGNAKHGYAGWLAWGPFFGANSDNNPGLTNCNTLVFRDSDAAEGALSANKTESAPALNAAITADAWGAPVATVDQNTENAVLARYNADVDPVSADFYFRWDDTYLYVGMVSADSDLAGHDDAWAGDGLQINVSANGETAGAYVTLKADVSSFNGGGADGVQYGLVVADGKLNAMAAIPFAALGITPEYNDILTFNLLRIIGNAKNGYAGWLAWGPFFGANSDNNPGVTETNKLILKDAAVEKNLFAASETDKAPSFDKAIDRSEWGAPAATISNGTSNAALANYEKIAENVSADVYFKWDIDKLYVGLVSADGDLRGDADSWKGDGLQLRMKAGTAMDYDTFYDVYVTLDSDNSSTQAGTNSGYAVEKNIIIEDGKLNVMLAVPFEALGVTPAEGKVIAFNMLRISGTTDSSYAGWLAWGSFFGADNGNNPGLNENNVLVLEGKSKKVEFDPDDYLATSIQKAPDFTKPISENAWGQPVATIANGQNNAVTINYEGTAEEVTADVYFRWDATKLYVGVASEDHDKVGSDDTWVGDGVQLRLKAGGAMDYDNFYDVYVTLNADGTTSALGTNNERRPEGNIVIDGDTLNIMIAVPLADLGIRGVEGERISFNMLRISGAGGKGYAGWLAWGSFFGPDSGNNAGVTEHNTMALKNYNGADYAISIPATAAAPDFNEVINSCTWGAPTASLENGKGNAALANYEKTAEDIKADVYLKYDSAKLYVGVVSADADLKGDGETYKGDGVQFRINSGTEMGEFFDIYVTLDGSSSASHAGSNSSTIDSIEQNIIVADGKLNVMFAIPFTELGITPAEGELLAFNMIRISGTKDSSYAGWLAWGAFFGADSDNNPGLMNCNVIKLGEAEAATPAHTPATDAKKDPDCTNAGLTEGSHCSVCAKILTAQEIVPALDHDFSKEWTIDKEATLESAGSMSHHCSRCDEKSGVTEIPRLKDSAETFTDVKSDSWFKAAVDFVLNENLMDGKGNNMFAPNEATERAQLVTILWRLAGSPEVTDATPFTDLKQDWYKTAVAWAYKNKIVNGITDTEFGPNEPVTREQIAAILYRYCEFAGLDVTARAELNFPDTSKIHSYAEENMKWAFAEELITGTKDETGVLKLDPRGNATRAQIATVLTRFCTQNAAAEK